MTGIKYGRLGVVRDSVSGSTFPTHYSRLFIYLYWRAAPGTERGWSITLPFFFVLCKSVNGCLEKSEVMLSCIV